MSNFEEWDIDTLRVRYKDLEEENNYLKQKSIRQLERYTKYHNTQIENFNNMLDDYIPISVIQNKIMNLNLEIEKLQIEYEKEVVNAYKQVNLGKQTMLSEKVKLLQELLEERK